MAAERPLLWFNFNDTDSKSNKSNIKSNISTPRRQNTSLNFGSSPRLNRKVGQQRGQRIAPSAPEVSAVTEGEIQIGEIQKSPKVSPRRRTKSSQESFETASFLYEDGSPLSSSFLTPIPEYNVTKRRPSREAEDAICKVKSDTYSDDAIRYRSSSFGGTTKKPDVTLRIQNTEGKYIDENSDVIERINVSGFTVDDLQVLPGRNRIRISGQNGLDELNRVIAIPQFIDPLTVKTVYENEEIVVTGRKSLGTRRWTLGQHGLMTIGENSSVRVTLDLPNNVDISQLHVNTVTKHYLTIAAPFTKSGEDMLETFEIPAEAASSSISTKKAGNSTVVIEIRPDQNVSL